MGFVRKNVFTVLWKCIISDLPILVVLLQVLMTITDCQCLILELAQAVQELPFTLYHMCPVSNFHPCPFISLLSYSCRLSSAFSWLCWLCAFLSSHPWDFAFLQMLQCGEGVARSSPASMALHLGAGIQHAEALG